MYCNISYLCVEQNVHFVEDFSSAANAFLASIDLQHDGSGEDFIFEDNFRDNSVAPRHMDDPDDEAMTSSNLAVGVRAFEVNDVVRPFSVHCVHRVHDVRS